MFSCAIDLSHDPAHGVDTFVIGEQIKHDRRVKYLIRHDPTLGYDTIWDNELGDTAWRDGHQHPPDKHSSHLHISLHHRFDVLLDVSPWFDATPEPAPLPPMEEDVEYALVYPENPFGSGKFKGLKPTFLAETDKGLLAYRLNAEQVEAARRRGIPGPTMLPNREFHDSVLLDVSDE